MITIARIDFNGLKEAIQKADSESWFCEHFIRTDAPNDAITDTEFQLLKAFFQQSNDYVTYDNFREQILPVIKCMCDPFYKDRMTIQSISEHYGWESHTKAVTFVDISDEYIKEGIEKLSWKKIGKLPSEIFKIVTESKIVPDPEYWVYLSENNSNGSYALVSRNVDETRDLYIF